MAEEAFEIVQNRNDFYRDNIGRVIIVIISIVFAIGLLIALAIYLHLKKPKPILFQTGDEYRIQRPVPLEDAYLDTPALLQWVSNTLYKVFIFDFINYNDQLKQAQHYFTDNGWGVFLNHLNTYANYNNVQTYKLFVNSSPSGAPIMINQGLLTGRYAWLVQMPLTISYAGYNPPAEQSLTLQVLVTRVPTVNNLDGVGIDNVTIINTSKQEGTG